MKKLYIISLLVILTSGNIFSQSGWSQLTSPTNKIIWSVCFIDENKGFIGIDSGVVYKTLNGGINWTSITLPVKNTVRSMKFVNQNTGYLALARNTTQGALFKSTDGGLSWAQITINYLLDPNDMFFYDTSIGFIANRENILKTSNGGLQWDTCKAEYPLISYSISYYGTYFKNAETGFVVGEEQHPPVVRFAVIWKTSNGGQNWSRVPGVSGCSSTRIGFINNDIGYSTGGCGNVAKTTNGGNSWVTVSQIFSTSLMALQVISENIVFVCGTGGLHKTINSGTNWQQIQVPNQLYTDITFPNINTGYLVGNFGYIFKTTNGGNALGINLISSEIPSQFSLHQNYPNPFNPVTKIRFDIPDLVSGGDRFVKLIIYDLLGREIVTLVNEQLKPGTYEVDWDGSGFASGVYFYSLVTPDFVETKRMVLLK